MPKGPDSRWIIRKPASRCYFHYVGINGTVFWTHYDNAYKIPNRGDAYAINEYVEGIVVELNPQTVNYSEEIII